MHAPSLRRAPLSLTLVISLAIHALILLGLTLMPPRAPILPPPQNLEVRLQLTTPKPPPPLAASRKRLASRPALGAQMSMDEEFSAEVSRSSPAVSTMASSEISRPQSQASGERAVSSEAESQRAQRVPSPQSAQQAATRAASLERQVASESAVLSTAAASPLRSTPAPTLPRELARESTAARSTLPSPAQNAAGPALVSAPQAMDRARDTRPAPALLAHTPPVATPNVLPPAPGTRSATALSQGETQDSLRRQVETARRALPMAQASSAQSQAQASVPVTGPADSHTSQGAARLPPPAPTSRPLASGVAPSPSPARASPVAAGAAASTAAVSLRQQQQSGGGAGLVAIIGATAMDPSALDGRGGDLLFSAALAGDGTDCFSYSGYARRAGLEGLVVLRVAVDKNGRASRTEIRNSSGQLRLDDLALAQAQRCARFVLRNRRGQPVAGVVDLPIRYRLEGGG